MSLSSVAVLLLGAVGACNAAASLQPLGSECALAEDCQPGLVCIPQKNGVSRCDSDLSSVQTLEDASVRDASTAKDAATTDAAGNGDAVDQIDAPVMPPKDADTPPVDANPPPVDANPPPVDAAGGG